jgi:hypothetical protein
VQDLNVELVKALKGPVEMQTKRNAPKFIETFFEQVIAEGGPRPAVWYDIRDDPVVKNTSWFNWPSLTVENVLELAVAHGKVWSSDHNFYTAVFEYPLATVPPQCNTSAR